MCSNVEIKARISDFCKFLKRALTISDTAEVVLKQTDTYFQVSKGLLKLRQIEGQKTELIFYDRPDTEGPKLSNYHKQDFQNDEEAEGLKKVLISSMGLVGVVNKTRHLFISGQTRIHVDNVEHLGHFMELEVMMNKDETLEYGQQIANQLMSKLGVSETDLISGSYINMLMSKTN